MNTNINPVSLGSLPPILGHGDDFSYALIRIRAEVLHGVPSHFAISLDTSHNWRHVIAIYWLPRPPPPSSSPPSLHPRPRGTETSPSTRPYVVQYSSKVGARDNLFGFRLSILQLARCNCALHLPAGLVRMQVRTPVTQKPSPESLQQSSDCRPSLFSDGTRR